MHYGLFHVSFALYEVHSNGGVCNTSFPSCCLLPLQPERGGSGGINGEISVNYYEYYQGEISIIIMSVRLRVVEAASTDGGIL